MTIRYIAYIILIVSVFTLWTSVANIYAQTPNVTLTSTPTPSPRKQLANKIIVLAKRHVDNDAGMKTEFVVELYRNNKVGLTSEQITEIYEKAYAYYKKAKKPTPWEQFRPNVGWVVAVLLFVLLILRDILKQGITKLFKVIGEKIYNRLAGSRLLRGMALRRYRKALFEKYENLHIPFRQNRPLKMQEVYVPLKVAEAKDTEPIEALQAITEYRRLMITGQPGSGKSMLCKHLAFTYAGEQLNLLDASTPILLELHRLSGSNLSIEEELIRECARNNFPHAKQFVMQSLKNGSLLLLFDGLDEINRHERGRVVEEIKELLDKYRQCRVVITCRTAVYNHEFVDSAEQTLEIEEFREQQMRLFLRSWEPDMPADKSIEQLMQTLYDRPRILALAHNPLMLTIIAYLYTDTPYVLPHSRSEFYRKATDQLLNEWHIEHNKFEFRDKKTILQHLALFYQDNAAQQQEDRRSMPYKTVITEFRKVLPTVNLKNDQVDAVLNEIVERSGLLLAIDGGERYQFMHLTLQEFLAAEELLNNEQGLIERFCDDPDVWRETVKLWCGLASDSTNLVRQVYEEEPITAFVCLADAKKLEPAVADEIINEFKYGLDAANEEIDVIAQAFGATASDLRPRGKSIFEYLQNKLQTAPEKKHQIAAAKALSYTNLPQAARILGQHYESLPEICEALVRMGNLAVPVFAALATQGNTDAMDNLQAIGTPQAAEKLFSLLWNPEPDIAYKAAWRLAALLPQPNIEEVLRNSELTVEQRQADWWDWIWTPFYEPVNSALPNIAGRIAYLIAQAPLETAPSTPPILDPRIAIPLVYIKIKLKNIYMEWTERFITLAATITRQSEKGIRERLNNYPYATINEIFRNATPTAEFMQLIEETFNMSGISTYERYLFSTIPVDKQIKLFSASLINTADYIKQNYWSNIFQSVSYDVSKSWHLWTPVAMATFVTLVALGFTGYTVVTAPVLLTWENGVLSAIVLAILSIGVWFVREALFLIFMLPIVGIGITLIPVLFILWFTFSYLLPILPNSKKIFIKGFLDELLDNLRPKGVIFLGATAFSVWLVFFTTKFILFMLPKLSSFLPVLNTFPAWSIILLIWLVFIGVSGLLSWRAVRLMLLSENPLQGILEPQAHKAGLMSLHKRWLQRLLP